MGKLKELKPSQIAEGNMKIPLADLLESDKLAKPSKNRNKKRNRQEEDDEFVHPSQSRKIIRAARQQQRELEPNHAALPSLVLEPTLLSDNEEGSGEESEQEEYQYDENFEINEEDERAMEMFMSSNPEPRRTLADIIMEKISEKHTELKSKLSDVCVQEVDPRVREMYEGVRDVLRKYRSGKIPKAFKIVPRLRNWEQILHITDPASWTAAAMYQATRLFASNLNDNMAQRFYNLVLLPRVRDDLAQYKKLNFHIYQSIHKALYKPGGFMKGLLLPLIQSGDCTLREAIIVGSVVDRNSVPVLHSCAAMLKIAEMDYTGASSIMLRIFFDKKYALPYRVIDANVFHFLRFQFDQRQLPVLWHQALLSFVQHYKADISTEQRDALLGLLKKHSHHAITPEIRRELQNAKCRDAEMTAPTTERYMEL